jgi:hypothetical protein
MFYRKSFRVFGALEEEMVAQDAVDDDLQEQNLEVMGQAEGEEEAEDLPNMFTYIVDDAVTPNDGEFVPVYPPGSAERRNGRYKLPPQARCAAHTLNLVAGDDLKKESHSFDPCFKSALEKAQKIWTHHSHSDGFKAAVKKLCGRRLKTPVPTRWNSLYDSVCVLNTILKDHDLRYTCILIYS